ncbi:hypothetical protein E3N88_02595 [Mikania micrantha]|uniref:Uncharacterized protein n=1 Tax=Mikania micrantha TaxID=192012 RepID=A0A5N6Q4E4_9ASTR|nr:hypothetical protein E3N88_02595 [Mikania micrantha]
MALILCFTLALNDATEASEAVLVGTVYCDTCLHQQFSRLSHFISGATVTVECGGSDGGKPRFQEEVKTDGKGEFRVKLPFSAGTHVDEIKLCSVKLVSSNEPDCALAVVSTATSSSIRVKAKTPENHVFSSGFFTFQPLEQPKRCRWESHENSNDEAIASSPLPSPVVDDEMLAPITLHTRRNPIGVELHVNNFGSSYHLNRLLPPLQVPMFPFQPPPDSMFIPEVTPPPDSMLNAGFQPPSDSMFNTGFQPPSDSMLNTGFQPPPPSDSMFNTGFQTPPPSDSMFNTSFQSPPPDPVFNDGFLSPPPDSMFNPNPLQPPPDSTLDPSQPSPPSLTPQLLKPPPPPPPPKLSPSVPVPSLDPQPDLIQATPPPPPYNPSFPAFPFQPSAGLPRMPPAGTMKPPLLHKQGGRTS